METPSMEREGKSVTKLCLAWPIREIIRFLLPITLFTIILSYPYWPPCPSLQNLSDPLLNSLPSLLDRRFMFLLCNAILVFISGDSVLMIKELPYSKKKLDVYDEYMIKKNELSLTQVSNLVVELKSTATEMGSQITGAELKEKQEDEVVTENEEGEAARGGEKQFIPDEFEGEEDEEYFREEDRIFDEFIARGYENWRREQQQLLNSKAKESKPRKQT